MRVILSFIALLIVAGFLALQTGLIDDVAPAPEVQSVQAAHAKIDIERFNLSNGMEVVLLPNHRVAAVSHTLWLRVGAGDDPAGKSGLAHYHEHLMFKGTPSVPAGEYAKRIEALGGQFNAFTGADFTGYYVDIAREHLAKVMQLEADRMQHLSPSDTDYEAERGVIIEERFSRVDSRPSALFAEQMQAALFKHHPYRIPIIGWLHEMKTLGGEDAKAFYQRHYHAGDMVLVVAGDITRAQLEPMAQRYYGALPARAPATRNWAQEPEPRSAQRVQFAHPEVRAALFQRRYLAPSYLSGKAQHVLPLSLFAQWLGGGKTSLLYRELVEKQQIAVSVDASYSGLSRGPSIFTVSAYPAPGVTLQALEQAVDAIIAQSLQTQIASEDLVRIKTIFTAGVIYARDSLSGLAQYAGYLRVLGLPLSHLTDWQARVEQVSAQQMQDAARAVLKQSGSVTGYLMPKEREAGDAS